MKTVYLETTIPSYLPAKPSGDLVTAAHQKITHDWWETRRGDYRLVVSDVVWDEIRLGDRDASMRRATYIEECKNLAVTNAILELSRYYRDAISALRQMLIRSISQSPHSTT